jgi:hypothetical protein
VTKALSAIDPRAGEIVRIASRVEAVAALREPMTAGLSEPSF